MSQLTFRDQMDQPILLTRSPQRIISLVPSQTELLAALGLDTEVVGITKFCIHPKSWFDGKPKVGGTKQFNYAVIDRLAPDLIIGNKEENYQEGIETLRLKYPVWMSDIRNLGEALDMISSLSEMLNKKEAGERIIHSIEGEFKKIIPSSGKTVLYLIWQKPWMAAGPDTFIHEMLSLLNLKNVLTTVRYPELTTEQIKTLNPDMVFLSSEPFPFREKHQHELQAILPFAKIILVDGEMFSWYGSRLTEAPAYFNSLQIT